jgi:hypothetical protein
MPVPDSERAVVTREKVHDYLLNAEHPDGGSKAIWFGSLGYERENWQVLADDLLKIARTCDDFTTETSPFGVKYKCRGEIGQPGHRPGRIFAVWIVEPGEPPRLVTAYPDDAE